MTIICGCQIKTETTSDCHILSFWNTDLFTTFCLHENCIIVNYKYSKIQRYIMPCQAPSSIFCTGTICSHEIFSNIAWVHYVVHMGLSYPPPVTLGEGMIKMTLTVTPTDAHHNNSNNHESVSQMRDLLVSKLYSYLIHDISHWVYSKQHLLKVASRCSRSCILNSSYLYNRW